MIDYRMLLLLAGLITVIALPAQEVITYELAGLTVVGCEKTDVSTIRHMSGLRVGDKIQLPGPAIPQAMRRLLKQQLFADVRIEQAKTQADLVWLDILIEEAPQIDQLLVSGLPKSKQRNWQSWFEAACPPTTAWVPAREAQLRATLAKRLEEEGYPLDAAAIYVQVQADGQRINLALQFSAAKRQKLAQIHWQGASVVSSKKLNRLLGKKIFSRTTFSQEWQMNAQALILAQYRDEGYVDAEITDSRKELIDGHWHWHVTISEGLPYTFGQINWQGAERFDSLFLQQVLGIQPGDPYRPDYLERKLNFDPEGGDISGLYMDRGHLFFQAEAIPTSLNKQEVDIVIRLTEGPIAIVRDVNITGNDRTNEHVIRRELRTQPGRPFSRAEVLRSQRALINLGYFAPESLGISTDVDPKTGTVDITYELEENRNDKFEVSASINPGGNNGKVGVIGTLGFSFNNFSLRQLLAGNWRQAHGDGQQLSIRAQSSGLAFQSYNLNFQEPWFRGQPQSLGFSLFHQRFASQDSLGWNNTLAVSGGSMNWGRRLPWGTGGWNLSGELGYQYIQLNNYLNIGLDDGTVISEGRFHNLYGKLQLAYQNVDDPFFPRKGSRLQFSGQWTPPWTSSNSGEGEAPLDRLSYHKYRISAEKFLPLGKKLVLRTSAKAGGLFTYNQNQSTPPFERFELGGNGMTGSQQAAFVGNDLLSLRGYDPDEIEGSNNGGGAAFAKFTAELRYPLFNSGAARGYILGFAEAGNAWKQVNSFDPFDLKRSAGLGVRLQLPMFGMIGFDYGIGFDQDGYQAKNWKDAGRFNLIFGWEPE